MNWILDHVWEISCVGWVAFALFDAADGNGKAAINAAFAACYCFVLWVKDKTTKE